VVPAPARPLSRRGAALAVAALAALALALRLAHLRTGLPFVFHSDFFQVEQAASLLQRGWFSDAYNYPHGLVYAYAALARLAGIAPERCADPAVHHVLGRALSVVAGVLLVPAVYRLARVACSRGVALLAAAAIAVDPAQILIDDQARPHAPVTLLLVLVAPAALRLVERPGPAARRALLAGAGLGLAAAVFHLGWIGMLWAAALCALRLRPARRAGLAIASLAIAFLAVWGGLHLLMNRPDVARPLPGRELLGRQSVVGVITNMGSWADLGRVPDTALNWLAAAPAVFAGAALFALLAARRRVPPRALLLYGSFPLLVFLVMSIFVGAHARYALAATPFLAVLAAAGCAALGGRFARGAAATLLLAVPLAGTVITLTLLGSTDTRLAVAQRLPALAAAAGRVALQDRLVVDRSALPAGVIEFPPHGAVEAVRADEAPRLALRDSGATLYLRATGSRWSRGPLAPVDLEALGFRLYGVLRGGPASTSHLPDLPDRLVVQLMRARRPGPSIELWATDAGAEALRAVVPPNSVRDLGLRDDPRAAVEAVLALRGVAGGGAVAAPDEGGGPPAMLARLDVDGDGAPEEVSSNVPAAQLAPLLALPGGAWRDGGAGAGADRGTLRLSARGAPVNGQPVLLLLTGAPPGARVRWSVQVSTGPADPGTDLPMPELSAGADGCVALAALWPREAPAGTTVTVQAFVADPAAPQGVAASNVLTATSPR